MAAAYLPIVCDRYGAMVRHLFVVGIDLTGVNMRAQVRLSGDSPGDPIVDLATQANGNGQGIRLVAVTSDDNGLPTSHVEIVINETTLEKMPYSGEIGDATQLAWDMQITLGGRKRRLARGEFEITGDGVTGASAAPINRPVGSGRPRLPAGNAWAAARLNFGEEQVTVQIVDAELVAPLAKLAGDNAALAQVARDRAEQAAGSAQATARYFSTRAAGEAASTTGQAFATDDGAGNVIYYRRTASGSDEIGRALTPARLAADDGASAVGYRVPAAAAPAQTLAQKSERTIDLHDFMTANQKAAAKVGNIDPADERTDMADAFDRAVSHAFGQGVGPDSGGTILRLKGARYRTSRSVPAAWRRDNAVKDDGDLRRMTIEGAGSGNTTIFYTGPADEPAYDLAGYLQTVSGGPPIADGLELRHAIRGLRLRRYPISQRTGTGIRMRHAVHTYLDDVVIDGFSIGIDAVDVIGLYARYLQLLSCNVGARAQVGDFTNPNVVAIRDSQVSSCSEIGLHIIRGASWLLDNVRFEGNGFDDESFTVLYEGGPPEGGVALTVTNGCYFENNRGRADIGLAWGSPYSGVVRIVGNTFHRSKSPEQNSDPIRIVQHHIDAAVTGAAAGATPPVRVMIDHNANGYKSFSAYEPSAGRSVLRIQTPNILLNEGVNGYANDIERPETNNFPTTGMVYPVLSATIEASGTYDLDPLFTLNVAGVTRPAGQPVGYYRIYYKVQPRQPLRVNANASLFNGSGSAGVSARANEYIDVVTLDATGTPADRAFTINALGSFA